MISLGAVQQRKKCQILYVIWVQAWRGAVARHKRMSETRGCHLFPQVWKLPKDVAFSALDMKKIVSHRPLSLSNLQS